jgi:hypothetical protein
MDLASDVSAYRNQIEIVEESLQVEMSVEKVIGKDARTRIWTLNQDVRFSTMLSVKSAHGA